MVSNEKKNERLESKQGSVHWVNQDWDRNITGNSVFQGGARARDSSVVS